MSNEKVVEQAMAIVATEEVEVQKGVSSLTKLNIDSQEKFDQASEILKAVAAKHKSLDDTRKDLVGPIKAASKNIDSKFKPILTGLKMCETILKQKIGGYVLAKAEENKKLLAEAEAKLKTGEAQEATETLQLAAQNQVEKTKGVSVQEVWTGKVVDASKIPREYLIPDEKQLLQLTKDMQGTLDIPGWRSFKTTTVRTSRNG